MFCKYFQTSFCTCTCLYILPCRAWNHGWLFHPSSGGGPGCPMHLGCAMEYGPHHWYLKGSVVSGKLLPASPSTKIRPWKLGKQKQHKNTSRTTGFYWRTLASFFFWCPESMQIPNQTLKPTEVQKSRVDEVVSVVSWKKTRNQGQIQRMDENRVWDLYLYKLYTYTIYH